MTVPRRANVEAAWIALDRLRSQPRVRLAPSLVEVLGADGALVERVLVARGDALAGARDFLRQALADQAPSTLLVWGALDPALAAGWAQAGEARTPIGWKLRDLGFSPSEQEQLFLRVKLVEADPLALRGQLEQTLQPHATLALPVLLAWLARRGEATRVELEARLSAIRGLVQARHALPLDEVPVSTVGDAPSELAHAVERAPLVVVHGGVEARRAMVQRHLAELPDLLRFRLRALPDRAQARALASSLAPHAAAIELPLTLILDARPGERDFARALEPLARTPGLELIVAVDEDSWRQASLDGAADDPARLELADVTVPPHAPAPVPPFASIDERDLEPALERAFAESGARIDEALALEPKSWAGAAALFRALTYRGLVEHAEAQAAVVDEAVERFGPAWPVVLDMDVAGLRTGADWTEGPGLSDESRAVIGNLRSRQRPREQIFVHARRLLERAPSLAAPEPTVAELAGHAELAFFRRRLGLAPLGFDGARLDAAIDAIAVEELAPILFAYEGEAGFSDWLAQARDRLVAKLAAETRAFAVDEADGALTVHFRAAGVAPEALGDQALALTWLLRQLLPGHDVYATRGYGHRVSPGGEADPTVLRVGKERLPSLLLVALNARALAIAELRLRPPTFEAHAREVVALRKLALSRLAELNEALEQYFRKQKGVQLPGSLVDVEAIERASLRCGRPPLLPREAVDASGRSSETAPPESSETPPLLRHRRQLALEPLKEYLSSLRTTFSELTMFLRQSVPVLAIQSLTKSHPPEALQKVIAQVGSPAEARDQSVRHLGAALAQLPVVERELHRLSAPADEDLSLLDRRERETWAAAFVLWERFAHHPSQTVAIERAHERLDEAERNAKETIRRHLRKLTKEGVAAQLLQGNFTWDDRPAMWLRFEVRSPSQLYSAYLAMHRALQAGFHEVGLSPLLRQGLSRVAHRIVAVPLVAGKALERAAWVSTPATLAAGDSRLWLEQLHRPARADEWHEAGLPVWDEPRLAEGERVQATIRSLFELLAELSDLSRAGARVEAELEAHLASRLPDIARLVAQITEQVAQIAGVLGAVPEDERPRRLGLLAAVQRLAELYQSTIATVLPPDGNLPSLEQIADAKRRLEERLSETEVFRLLWTADVLGLPI